MRRYQVGTAVHVPAKYVMLDEFDFEQLGGDLDDSYVHAIITDVFTLHGTSSGSAPRIYYEAQSYDNYFLIPAKDILLPFVTNISAKDLLDKEY